MSLEDWPTWKDVEVYVFKNISPLSQEEARRAADRIFQMGVPYPDGRFVKVADVKTDKTAKTGTSDCPSWCSELDEDRIVWGTCAEGYKIDNGLPDTTCYVYNTEDDANTVRRLFIRPGKNASSTTLANCLQAAKREGMTLLIVADADNEVLEEYPIK